VTDYLYFSEKSEKIENLDNTNFIGVWVKDKGDLPGVHRWLYSGSGTGKGLVSAEGAGFSRKKTRHGLAGDAGIENHSVPA
jgi:hypothetical protein